MPDLDHNRVQIRHSGRDQRRQRQQRQLHGEKDSSESNSCRGMWL